VDLYLEIEGGDLLVFQISMMAVGFGINVSITDLNQIFTNLLLVKDHSWLTDKIPCQLLLKK
jgi:hypothetical protein